MRQRKGKSSGELAFQPLWEEKGGARILLARGLVKGKRVGGAEFQCPLFGRGKEAPRMLIICFLRVVSSAPSSSGRDSAKGA